MKIGRLLWMANWIARFTLESLGSEVEKYGRIFRMFEDTGKLHLPD